MKRSLINQSEVIPVVEDSVNNSNTDSSSDQNNVLSVDELVEMVVDGKDSNYYLDCYCKLIDLALVRGINKRNLNYYTEKHHILPKCMEGKDEKDNYVLLTLLEHIIAHCILFKLYPHNKSLAFSANAMLLPSHKNRKDNTNELKIIDKNKLLNAVKLREDIINSLSTPIVAYNDGPVVLKIYNSVSSVISDRFSKESVWSCITIDGSRRSGGLMWMLLDDFEKLYPKELNNYYNIHKTNNFKINWDPIEGAKDYKRLSSLGEKNSASKKIICYDDNNNILRIYNYMKESKKDGFSYDSISDAIKYNRKYSGYNWILFKDWKDEDKINEYYSLETLPKILKETNKIVCYDKDNNILKIYDSSIEVAKDGFISSSILNKSKTGGFYKGYYWKLLNNWTDEDKLNNYYTQQNNDIKIVPIENNIKDDIVEEKIPKDLRIVKCDKSCNVYKIYNSPRECFIENNIPEGTFYSMVRHNKFRGKFRYIRYNEFKEIHNDKLNDYYNNGSKEEVNVIEDNKVNYKNIIKLVCHDVNFYIINIYEDIKSTEKDGFIVSRLYKKFKNNNTIHDMGYYWTRFEIFSKNHPEKINK